MANISDFLKKLMEARYGRDVRAAIHDSIDAMNTESTQAYSASIDAKDSAQKSATAASGSAANAKNYSDSAKKYAESASAAIEASYDTQSTESKVITNTIEAPMMVTKFTKNLLNPTLGTTTVNGVTCTKNSDGTYTLNGTATAFTYFSLLATVENGFSGMKYVGAPDGSGWNSYFLWGMYRDKDKKEVKNITSYKYSNGVVVEDCETYPYLDLRIAIREGQSLNNLIFKPMITTDLDATYDDYVPYSEYRIKTCGKNLLPISSVGSQTINGITFTNNGDGTWTLNGTATSGATLYISPFGSGLIQKLKDKEFVVVGTEGTNKDTEAFVQLTLSKNGTEKDWFKDFRTIRKIGDADNACFEITVKQGYTCNAMLVKPMITDITSATYDDFEPYKESSVNVTSMSQAPLLGLKTFPEITHVISNGNVTAAYALTETGKYVMECKKNTGRKTCVVGFDNTSVGDWFKFAAGKLIAYDDIEALFFIKESYVKNDFGILQIKIRYDQAKYSDATATWVLRNGFSENLVRISLNSDGEYELYIKNPYGRYSRIAIEKVSEFHRTKATESIVLYDAAEKETSEPTASVESSDGGYVLAAKKDENGNVIADTYATNASIEKWEKTGDTISADGCSGSEFSNYKSNIGLNMFSMFGRTPTKNSVSFSLPTATKIPFFQVNAMVHNKASGLYEPVAAYLYGTKCTVEIPDYSNYDIVRVSGIY